MPNSIHLDKQGPDWPLGSIVVATPGTPVNIMSVVDPSNVNSPSTSGNPASDEYTVACNQIIIQGFKNNAGAGLVPNTGNLYLVRKGVTPGSGNRADTGVIVLVIPSGQTGVWGSAALVRNGFNPYRYSLDADNANDAGQVTLLIF
jgi:hypothetical protein